MNNVAAVILAAGKGTRLNSTVLNKVLLPVGGKPMIGRTVDILRQARLSPIVVVVGFRKKKVMDYLQDQVLYAVQTKRLGTAHAVACALQVISAAVTNILVVNGDDSYCYPSSLLRRLISLHRQNRADLTLLTVEKNDPTGLGRILRDNSGKIIGSVEEKDATPAERKIKEINPQCWVFKVSFLQEFLPQVKKSKITGEYYLNALLALAVENKRQVVDLQGGKIAWRGVNTPAELAEARKLIQHSKEKSRAQYKEQ